MIPAHTRFAAIVLGSFVLWLPALWSFLQGDLGVGAIGVRYLGALGMSGGAVALLGGLTQVGTGDGGTGPGSDVDAAVARDRRAGDG